MAAAAMRPATVGAGRAGGGLGLVGEGAEEADEVKAKKEQEQKDAAAKKRAKVSVVRSPPVCPGQLRADRGKPP